MLPGSIRDIVLYLTILGSTAALPQLTVDIPPEESAALAGIVEDEPSEFVVFDDEPHDQVSPAFQLMFRVPLPIPPIKEPLMTLTNPISGNPIQYFEVNIKPFTKQIFPNLRAAQLVGYDGISPGPTFMVERGTETVVRFINGASQENSVHLHGSPSRAPWDGWAEDVTQPEEYKDYYFPNHQSARMLWYHDHALGITAENAYFGQAGTYIITDPAEDALGLPSGYGKFDIPLVLSSKTYNPDGTLLSIDKEDESLWGDVIHVNGQPWPVMNVEPRKYRFRILNSSVSRSFALHFAFSNSPLSELPFHVIASDAGLLNKPVYATKLYHSIAERWEIVFDFSKYKGKTIELRNLEEVGGVGADDDYATTDKVMRFVVGSSLSQPDTSVLPEQLREVPFPPPSDGDIDHQFRFHRSNSEWLINDVGFMEAENRVLANVPLGTVEIWELQNNSGGWTHPVHVHLVDFRVLSREGGHSDDESEHRGVMPYEAEGLKDVVWLAKNEKVRVEAHYAPWPGLYMFHCHNLVHEDQDMMAAFNVSVLPDYGYNSSILVDPMEERWRAKPYTAADVSARTGAFSEESILAAINEMVEVDPYGHLEQR